MFALGGCTTNFGAEHGRTVIVIVVLSIDDPQLFDARTQYLDVVDGVTVTLLPVPIGEFVTPAAPAYH